MIVHTVRLHKGGSINRMKKINQNMEELRNG